jgi:hypothetical protein
VFFLQTVYTGLGTILWMGSGEVIGTIGVSDDGVAGTGHQWPRPSPLSLVGIC